MQATAYKIAARLYSEVRAREPGVRRDADIEDLHKFRVATRRLRAALRAFRPVFGRAVLRDAAASTRAVARATNAARDLDVFIEALEEDDFTTRVPTLMAHISGDRTVAIRGTVDTLDGDAYDDLIRATESLLVQIHPQTHAVERRRALRRVRDEAPRMIGIRLRRVLAYADGLAADDDERMHDLRIAIKQLRYVLEFVRDILPDDADKAVNELKALQDSLGDLNDCAVQRVYVAAHTSDAESQANMSEVERVTLELLAVRIELRRERALARFLEEWNGFIDADRQRLLAFRLGL
ncbi:CHAD domain-containing protein [Candidatus Poribacteria bacterium]|nr:CHAD domain-containing protein [Candidatus Poribacteria bacterium]